MRASIDRLVRVHALSYLLTGTLLLAGCNEASGPRGGGAGTGTSDPVEMGGVEGLAGASPGGDGGSGGLDPSVPDGGQPAQGPEEPGAGDAGAANLGPPGIRGILADETGKALPNSVVLACMSTVCLFGKSDTRGHFEFQIQPPAEVALKTPEALDAEPRLGALLIPIAIAGSLIDVGTVHVPNMPLGPLLGATAEDPQTLDVGDGLTLTLSRADLTPHIGDRLSDVAARQIPLSTVRPMPDMEGERLMAVYAIHPFAAVSTRPIAVRAPTTLPDGTPVMFRSISEIDGRLSAAAHGVARKGEVSTDPNQGLTELTWLVISY